MSGKIHELLIAVMRDVPAVGKDHANQKQRYRFRAVDDFVAAVGPVLVKHGVSLSWAVEDVRREEHKSGSGNPLHFTVLTVRYTLTAAEDGSSVSIVAVGEGMDSGDKSANKAMAGALKYALSHALLIPTQDRSDSEYAEPEPRPGDDLRAAKKAVMVQIAKHRQGCPDGMPDADWAARLRTAVLGDKQATTVEDCDALAAAIPTLDPVTGDRLPAGG